MQLRSDGENTGAFQRSSSPSRRRAADSFASRPPRGPYAFRGRAKRWQNASVVGLCGLVALVAAGFILMLVYFPPVISTAGSRGGSGGRQERGMFSMEANLPMLNLCVSATIAF